MLCLVKRLPKSDISSTQPLQIVDSRIHYVPLSNEVPRTLLVEATGHQTTHRRSDDPNNDWLALEKGVRTLERRY